MSSRVTVAHDYFTQRGGAERVAILLARTVGGGKVLTSAFVAPETFPEAQGLEVQELLPWLPRALARRRTTLAPFAALAFLRLRVDEGVVVCSTSGWSHWLRGRAPRLVYCHTPARWLYEPADYFKDRPKIILLLLAAIMAPLRAIDRQRMRSAALVLANGPITAERIRRVYGIDAEVLIPPPGIEADGPQEPVTGVHEPFFLTVSRARSYKNLDLVTSVFAQGTNEQLVVVGGEPDRTNDSILKLGRVSDAQLRWLYQHARAVICVAREDLGLVPIEAFQFGTPAVALRAGGYLATCTPERNAVFVESEDATSLRRALDELNDSPLDRERVRESGRVFSLEHFEGLVRGLISSLAGSSEPTTDRGGSEVSV